MWCMTVRNYEIYDIDFSQYDHDQLPYKFDNLILILAVKIWP
jgi:hypothetical protein